MNVWSRFVSELTELEGQVFTEEHAVALIQLASAVKKEQYHLGLREGARSELTTMSRHVETQQRVLESNRREDEGRREQGWR